MMMLFQLFPKLTNEQEDLSLSSSKRRCNVMRRVSPRGTEGQMLINITLLMVQSEHDVKLGVDMNDGGDGTI